MVMYSHFEIRILLLEKEGVFLLIFNDYSHLAIRILPQEKEGGLREFRERNPLISIIFPPSFKCRYKFGYYFSAFHSNI